jgi:hypothetical protein
VAGVCSGIGAAGMVWLWWVWRQNWVDFNRNREIDPVQIANLFQDLVQTSYLVF